MLIPAGSPRPRTRSNPDEPPASEEGAALFIADVLRRMDFSVDLVAKRPGRPNFLGLLPGTDPDGPSLILNDHLGQPIRPATGRPGR